MTPKSITRGFMYIRKMLLVIKKKNIELVWVTAEFNLPVTFMFIDKTNIPFSEILSNSDSRKHVNVMSPKTININCIYKLICEINKRSLLGFQQEIAYYLIGSFQI